MDAATVKYRPDIDGLRALAILPVVWFHSGLPGMSGGFTGVDTFFVISGYLITLIIHREVAERRFRFSHFYERRVRRIAPALLLTTAATTAAALFLLLPYELEQYGRSALATLAMSSNIFFWRTGGYFGLVDSSVPLLHTWSLGVEEQFYLFFPVILIAAERYRASRSVIATLLIASLVLCLVGIARAPAATFYLLPARGWELMIGAALAVGLLSPPKRLNQTAGFFGITLLAASAVLLSSDKPFPDWRALVPTIGAALVIGSGPGTLTARMLSVGPLVFVGKISYSLYLWHWPIFVFLRHFHADPHLSAVSSIAGILLAFALATASYRWVETPARQGSKPYRSVLIACGIAAGTILLANIVALFGRGLPQRLPLSVVDLAEVHFAHAPLAQSCTDVGLEVALHRCHIGPPGQPRVLLWGDSHAAAISEGVALGLGEPGILISMGTCPPTLGWASPALRGTDAATCRELSQRTLELVERSPAISKVVLSSYWVTHERRGGPAFWRSTQQLVDRLERRGKQVVLVAGIPDPGADVPWASAIRRRFQREPLKLPCQKSKIPLHDVTLIDLSASFCGKSPEGLFTDSNHISRKAGVEIVAPGIQRSTGR